MATVEGLDMVLLEAERMQPEACNWGRSGGAIEAVADESLVCL